MRRALPTVGLAAAVPLILATALARPATGQSLSSVLEVAQAGQAESAASQNRVDSLADQTRTLLTQYRGVRQQLDSLRVYDGQLEQLVKAQRAERESTKAQIDGVSDVERQIMPLMSRMIDTLDRFVKADVPFLLGERTRRVKELRDLLLRSDVTVAEKYRRLTEAWQIENDYGHTIEAYTGELDVDGKPRKVDFLRIGRLALFYQTLDGEHSGAWRDGAFVPIDDSYNDNVRHGLRIARKQAPPDLLLLPIAAAQPAQAAAVAQGGE